MADELLLEILEEGEAILNDIYKRARYPKLDKITDKIHYYNLLENEWFS